MTENSFFLQTYFIKRIEKGWLLLKALFFDGFKFSEGTRMRYSNSKDVYTKFSFLFLF